MSKKIIKLKKKKEVKEGRGLCVLNNSRLMAAND